mmetsp:Transcript_43538/g.72400  ORF Transcript_43538/g.72400 Transcript_43538/m.72400 type:complete len:85 (-) Transcript_43538:482-736(-)
MKAAIPGVPWYTMFERIVQLSSNTSPPALLNPTNPNSKEDEGDGDGEVDGDGDGDNNRDGNGEGDGDDDRAARCMAGTTMSFSS